MIKENIKISAVIPAYNAESYIADSINSVLNQTFSPSEIIVVDDGSIDNTKDVVESFGEKVTYIYQENKGNGGARNTGIRHANSCYIAFLDADDLWIKNHLEKAVLFFSKNIDVQWYASAFYHTQRGVSKKDLRQYNGPFLLNGIIPNYFIAQSAYYNEIIRTSTVVLTKAILESINGFDETFRRSVDRICWFELAMISPKFGYCHSPSAIYIATKGSVGHQTDLSEPTRFIEQLDYISRRKSKNRNDFNDSQKFIHRTIRNKFAQLLSENDDKISILFNKYGGQLNPIEFFLFKKSISNKKIRWIHIKIDRKRKMFLGRLNKLIGIYKSGVAKTKA